MHQPSLCDDFVTQCLACIKAEGVPTRLTHGDPPHPSSVLCCSAPQTLPGCPTPACILVVDFCVRVPAMRASLRALPCARLCNHSSPCSAKALVHTSHACTPIKHCAPTHAAPPQPFSCLAPARSQQLWMIVNPLSSMLTYAHVCPRSLTSGAPSPFSCLAPTCTQHLWMDHCPPLQAHKHTRVHIHTHSCLAPTCSQQLWMTATPIPC